MVADFLTTTGLRIVRRRTSLPEEAYPEAEQRIAFYTSLVEEVEALPGVVSVGLINQLPIRNPGTTSTYTRRINHPRTSNRIWTEPLSTGVYSRIISEPWGPRSWLGGISPRPIPREIGVRMALGASRRQVAKSIVSRGMGMVAIGLVVGLVLSYWATDLIQQLLLGVESTDPATFIMAALGFGVVALVACFLPAWRAMRVDPVTILQAE